MKYTLYFAPGACSFVPHAMLEVANANFEPRMVKLHKGEQHSPAYTAINPRGQVPVLVRQADADTPVVLTQIVAIVNYLNEAFPAAQFLPTEPMAKAQALSTLAWMNNTVHTTFTHIFMPQKYSATPETQADLKRFNTALYAKLLSELDAMAQAMQR
ncbi:MAG: Glutathione S-transferase, partial [Pseudomonadota bacterium]